MNPASAPAPEVGGPVASERPNGMTVFEAVDRQLGLKLALQKHSMQVIVIDQVNRKPSEN